MGKFILIHRSGSQKKRNGPTGIRGGVGVSDTIVEQKKKRTPPTTIQRVTWLDGAKTSPPPRGEAHGTVGAVWAVHDTPHRHATHHACSNGSPCLHRARSGGRKSEIQVKLHCLQVLRVLRRDAKK